MFLLKKRSSKKPLSVIFGSLRNAEKYVNLDNTGMRLVKTFMPGPLTLVVKPKKKLASSTINEIAFRIPSNSFAKTLAKKFGKPITATSANISGEKPIYGFEKVLNLFYGKVDAIVNAGNLPKRKVSTIFNLLNMETVRKGGISENRIKKCLLQNQDK